MKRHILFIVGLSAAAYVFMLMSFPLAMNECQLHNTQAAIDACFESTRRSGSINDRTAIFFAVLAAALHVAKSRWVPVALVGLALGPFAAWALLS